MSYQLFRLSRRALLPVTPQLHITDPLQCEKTCRPANLLKIIVQWIFQNLCNKKCHICKFGAMGDLLWRGGRCQHNFILLTLPAKISQHAMAN